MFSASSGLSRHSAFWGRLECWGRGVIGGHSRLHNRNPQVLLMPSLPSTALCFWEDGHEVALDKELFWDPRTWRVCKLCRVWGTLLPSLLGWGSHWSHKTENVGAAPPIGGQESQAQGHVLLSKLGWGVPPDFGRSWRLLFTRTIVYCVTRMLGVHPNASAKGGYLIVLKSPPSVL